MSSLSSHFNTGKKTTTFAKRKGFTLLRHIHILLIVGGKVPCMYSRVYTGPCSESLAYLANALAAVGFGWVDITLPTLASPSFRTCSRSCASRRPVGFTAFGLRASDSLRAY